MLCLALHDLGPATALTGPQYLHWYSEGLDPGVLKCLLFISDVTSLKVRQSPCVFPTSFPPPGREFKPREGQLRASLGICPT